MKTFAIVFIICIRLLLWCSQHGTISNGSVRVSGKSTIKSILFTSNLSGKSKNLEVFKHYLSSEYSGSYIENNLFINEKLANGEFKLIVKDSNNDYNISDLENVIFSLKFDSPRVEDDFLYCVNLSAYELHELQGEKLHLYTKCEGEYFYELYTLTIRPFFDTIKKSSKKISEFWAFLDDKNTIRSDTVLRKVKNGVIYKLINTLFFGFWISGEVKPNINNSDGCLKKIKVDAIALEIIKSIESERVKEININNYIYDIISELHTDKLIHELLIDLVKFELKNLLQLSNSPNVDDNNASDFIKNLNFELVVDNIEDNTKKCDFMKKFQLYKKIIQQLRINFKFDNNIVFRLEFNNLDLPFASHISFTLFAGDHRLESTLGYYFINSIYFEIKEFCESSKAYVGIETTVDLANICKEKLSENIRLLVTRTIIHIYSLVKNNQSLVYDIIFGPNRSNFEYYRQGEMLKGCVAWLKTQNIKVKYIVNLIHEEEYKYGEQLKNIFNSASINNAWNTAISNVFFKFNIFRYTRYVISAFFVTDKSIEINGLVEKFIKNYIYKKEFEEFKMNVKKKYIYMNNKLHYVYYFQFKSDRIRKTSKFFFENFCEYIKNYFGDIEFENTLKFYKIVCEIRCNKKNIQFICGKKRAAKKSITNRHNRGKRRKLKKKQF